MALVVCAIVFCSGCTSVSGSQNTVPTETITPATTATNISLSTFALTTADLPDGSKIETSRQKSADDVGTIAKDLGWQQGYVMIGSIPPDNTTAASVVTQTITVYSEDKMFNIVSIINTNDRQLTGFVFSDMPRPATGPNTRAFSAVVSNKTIEPEGTGNIIGSKGNDTSKAAEGYFEVIFSKGNILEVIRMSGPGADYDTLKLLSEKAYAKLG